jgi:hypothetical protein
MEGKCLISKETITVEIQINMNRRMFEKGRISFEIYKKANDILLNKLTEQQRIDRISYNEMKPGDRYGTSQGQELAK